MSDDKMKIFKEIDTLINKNTELEDEDNNEVTYSNCKFTNDINISITIKDLQISTNQKKKGGFFKW